MRWPYALCAPGNLPGQAYPLLVYHGFPQIIDIAQFLCCLGLGRLASFPQCYKEVCSKGKHGVLAL
jgi:hypothetical protein